MLRLLAAAAAAITLSLAATPAQATLAAGQEGPLPIGDNPHPCVLYVPTDWQPGLRLPLILFLHGSGGKPTTWPWRAATGGKGYLVCGMSYGGQDDGGAEGIHDDAQSITKMLAFLAATRAQIAEQYGVDEHRVFLSGLSMGGWGTNFYGFQTAARDLYRGYAILAAGLPQGSALDLDVLRDKPLLLLNGEQDANLPAANRGRPEYERALAIVTQVVIPGEGHTPALATMVGPLASWLAGIAESDDCSDGASAITWRDGTLHDVPGEAAARPDAALLACLRQQEFVSRAAPDRPLLLFVSSPRGNDTEQPTTAVRDRERLQRALFRHPHAVATPAVACEFTCVRVDQGSLDRRDHPLLQAGKAPFVLLLDRERTAVRVLPASQLSDTTLAAAMRALLTAEQAAAADQRLLAARPLLPELTRLLAELGKERQALAKLRQAAKAAPANKVAARSEAIVELEARLAGLRARLRQ